MTVHATLAYAGRAQKGAGDTGACPSTHHAQCEPARSLTCADLRMLLFWFEILGGKPFLPGSCFGLVQIPSTTRKHLKGYETPGNFPELDAHFRHLFTVIAGNERQVLRWTGTKSDQINTHGTKQDTECTNHVRPGLIFVRPGLIFVQDRTNRAIDPVPYQFQSSRSRHETVQ